MKLRLIPLLVLLLLSSVRARATFVKAMDLDELIDVSDLVFQGTVESVEARWNADKTGVFTFVTFKDLEVLKGSVEGNARTYTLRIDGGTLPGEIEQVQAGAPVFKTAERSLLFLNGNLTRTCPIVGVRQGSFQVARDTATGQDVLYRDGAEVLDLSGQDAVFRPTEPDLPENRASAGVEDDPKAQEARLRIEREARKARAQLRERPRRRAADLVRELRSHIDRRSREGRFQPPRPSKSADKRKHLTPLR